MSISSLIPSFQDWLITMRSPATVSYYQFYLGIIDRYFFDKSSMVLSHADVIAFIAHIKKTHPQMKAITINKVIGALKTLLKVTGQPLLQFDKLKETKKVIPTIPLTTVNLIFDYLNRYQHHGYRLRNLCMLQFLFDTGLRMHELRHLERDHYDEEQRCFLVTKTKTSVDRYVFLTRKTAILYAHYRRRWPETRYVFYDEKTQGPLSTSAIESMLYRLKKTLKLNDNITPHKWRHTFATQFLTRGGDLETLRMLLGHANLKTTQQYLHLTKRDISLQYHAIMDKD